MIKFFKKLFGWNKPPEFVLTIPCKKGSNTQIGDLILDYAAKDNGDNPMCNVIGKAVVMMIASESEAFQYYTATVAMLETMTDEERAKFLAGVGEVGDSGKGKGAGDVKIH